MKKGDSQRTPVISKGKAENVSFSVFSCLILGQAQSPHTVKGMVFFFVNDKIEMQVTISN